MEPVRHNVEFTDRTALVHLRELHIADSKLKHKDLPFHTAPKFSASKTNSLTSCIKHFLKLKQHHCERTSNQGRILDHRTSFVDTVGLTRTVGSVQRIRSSGTPGTSDLKASISGKFVAIEIKSESTKDRQRPNQKAYQQEVESSKGIYFVATSFHQFLNYYYSNFESWSGEK